MRAVRLLAAAAVTAGIFLIWRSNSLSPDVALAQNSGETESAFLVRFGVTSSSGEKWDGSVKVEGARLVGLDPWQFDEGDEIIPENSWKCATKKDTYWYAPWERSLEGTKRIEKLSERGVLLRLGGSGSVRVSVETAQGSFSFDPTEIPWARPKQFLGGRVDVSRVPGPNKITSDAAAEDYLSAIESSVGDRWLAWQSYITGGDRLWVRRNDDPPQPVTPASEDLFGTALVEGANGRIWLIWSAQKDNNWDLYGASFDGSSWSSPERLTTAAGSDIYHSAARDAKGRVYLAWQSSRSGSSDIYLRVHDGSGWGGEVHVSDDPANDWEPAVAATADGQAAVVWDTYSKGNYDVVMRPYENGRLGTLVNVANSPSFETRPTATYGPDQRLWLAWDEGDAGWGKDYVAGIQERGLGLLMRRQVRIATYSSGRLEQLPGNLSSSLPAEESQVFQRPKLAFDGNGNLWTTFRYRTNTPVRRGDAYRAMWRPGAVSFQNGAWTPLVRLAQGFGRIDAGAAFHTGRDGNLRAYWVSDGRNFPSGFPADQDIYSATISAGPRPRQEPKLVSFEASKDAAITVHSNEAADVARLRDYRVNVGGKSYQIVRGDMHRHTDISWDGNRDGSLHDCYRYAMDAAAMDYLGVADHQAGDEIEYQWWMIQKAVDLFTVHGRFAPLYGYERSRGFPSGHRNVMFAQRGIPVLPFSEAERTDNKNTGVANLYQYLRENRGIVMSHTSATGAGTDWRDSDPEVETLVEIYQGYRANYEHEGAPRSRPTRAPHNAGFVWKAWEKGLKLGLQSSSDHVSTHASYGMIYVDEFSQEGILNGIRGRRSYAATDNILVDFRVNGHLMGEAFESNAAPKIEARITGTAPIRKVEVIRDNSYIHTQQGFGAQLSFTFVDNDVKPGESYYYIRVEQEDGELAWSSPVWVTHRK